MSKAKDDARKRIAKLNTGLGSDGREVKAGKTDKRSNDLKIKQAPSTPPPPKKKGK